MSTSTPRKTARESGFFARRTGSVRPGATAAGAADGTRQLTLGIEGYSFGDLFDPHKLAALHTLFVEELRASDPAAADLLEAWQAQQDAFPVKEVSKAVVAVAPHVGRFVAKLFGVEEEELATSRDILADKPLFEFRKGFAKRRLLKKGAGEGWAHGEALADEVASRTVDSLAASEDVADEEKRFAVAVNALVALQARAKKAQKADVAAEESWGDPALLQSLESLHSGVATSVRNQGGAGAELPSWGAAPETLQAFCDWLLLAVESHLARRMGSSTDTVATWVSLFEPHKTNFATLVELRRPDKTLPELAAGPEHDRRERVEPFALTDQRASRREVAQQVDYCIYCHDRDKDSCSKGLREKTKPGEATQYKKNPLGVELKGCPLDEKIGEMHVLRKEGEVIASLAAVTLDNPMLPGTGHRICNDCMKGCVYQAQEPVNIPQIETRTLTDVLSLPWGFEIYSFLTRWNPLNVRRPYPRPYVGKNVMVVGLGPAGYTLAHYLVNEGFGVVGMDGLKLEPLPPHWVGSSKEPPQPIFDFDELKQPLENRTLLGFGGVSEYGITVRWDKNFLTAIYLNLLRRRNFRAYGGIRFGGTLTVEDAWRLGFDHVAIASGAGKPTQIRMKNNLIRGIRKASDFLMGLQLTGAYKRASLANLQVRLPAVVIGGGLTAIDTATELCAYYVVQAERTAERYDALAKEQGEENLRARFDVEELEVLDEVVGHGRALLAERAAAAREGREPRVQQLLQSWGGVRVAYRRRLEDSPAYRLNHEEIAKCLEEGVQFMELVSPTEAHPDRFGSVEAMTFDRMEVTETGLRSTGEQVKVDARTVCVAAGTHPNVSYEKEYPGTFSLGERGYLENHKATMKADGTVSLEKTDDGSGFFTSYLQGDKTVSYYGDNHPRYAGNVVKAMASAKHGHLAVSELFEPLVKDLKASEQPARDAAWQAFGSSLNEELLATVEEVRRLAPNIIEVIIRSPLAARKFQPGQFYRFQNFEAYAPIADGVPLLMEGLALTGAWVDREKGLMSTIALEMGTSSRMCSMLTKGEPVLLMGPTGAPTETPGGETVLLAGGGLGNAVLFSIARALREHGSRVIYFAGYKEGESLFKQDDVEASTDQVIWSTDSGKEIEPRRPQDRHFRGNIVQAMLAYERGELGEKHVSLSEVDRIIAIGSDRMMAAIKEARRGALAPYLKKKHRAIGSINSPMQCMLKAVCAQCLQKVVDPETGEESMVYTCFNQDQDLDAVDFSHLAARLRQNSAQEKLANMWMDRLLEREQITRV